MPETSTQTFDLSAHLDRLVDPNRKILQLFAIIYETVPASLVVACLKKLKLKQTPQSWFTVRTLQPRIDVLLGMALLKRDLETGLHYRIVPAIADTVVLQAIKDGVCEEMMHIVASEIPALLGSSRGSQRLVSFDRAVREIRLGLLTSNTDSVIRFLNLALSQRPDDYRKTPPLVHLYADPWDAERISRLPLQLQLWALEEILEIKLLDLQSVADMVPLLEQYRQESCPKTGPGLRALYMLALLVQGRIKEAEELLAGEKPVEASQLFQGWICFLHGDFRRAISTLDKTMALLDDTREEHRQRNFPHFWGGLFLLLALLQTNQFEGRQRILSLVQRLERHRHNPLAAGYQAIRAVVVARGGDADHALNILGYRSDNRKGNAGLPWLRQEFTPLLAARDGGWAMALPKAVRHVNPAGLAELLRLMALYWVDHETMAVETVKDHLWAIHRQALQNDYPWAALESAALLRQWPEETEEFTTVVSELESRLGFSCIVDRIRREERWEQTLSALLKLTGGHENEVEEVATISKRRLVWLIETHGQRGSIQAREQTLSEDGEWSRGKAVSTRKLHSSEAQLWGFLTPQDLKVCQTIRQEYIYNGTRYDFEWARGMLALVGHPHVYWLDNPMVTIEVVRSEPELLVNEHNGRVKIRFAQKIEGPGVLVLREGERRCRVIEITNDHHKIADILGPDGFNGPESQKARVMGVVARLANLVTIQSAVDADVAEIDEVATDSRPRLQLVPQGEGLQARLLVRPFADAGPWCSPGRGGVLLFAEREGKRVKTRRNFRKEKELAEEVIALCPTLAGRSEDDRGWFLPRLEECLELLLELKELGDKVLVEWPEGERFRVAQTITMDKLHIKIRRERDWFAVAGTVTLDDAMVLEMSTLLKLSQKKESRFIPLGNGQFAALTEAFRRRLLEMLDRGEETGKGWRVHTLTAPWLHELAGESGRVAGDKHWKEQVARLEAMESDEAEVPSTFQAELRDYQKVGFRWLHRLSVWGVGGCLADDMGLGKTLQAMALLLSRAPDGVGLVVAPTSVCSNWEAEIKRFAPTLKPILFGGNNRKEMVTGLQAFDVLVVSYALLQIEGELLGEITWHTIVLDEAQAIKNRMTKRSQSAMALKGHFRVITTGTPIENHLGELWNLFRFLNPGLLGSLERFNERFAQPIERFRDREASRRLKEIIRPFILRRTKNQVLQELPPLTEIVLHVDMSPEEAAFYEALRLQAMSNLEGVQGKDGKNHVAILAELMTLRRACCNSRLIKPDAPWPCSKLETFKEVARTLLDNKHKALVFSQFVDHLSIIREFFTAEGIAYQYLDGSTPAPQRKKNIDAFQGGQGDFFLISLKAGGVGLNLTAADYVIHMDPWWNPAVEDQASNRAHRFGQKRPVTVYRLVTRGTIEEKIVELHAQKRDLADDLLEGGDRSGRLTAEELLGLIRAPLGD
ncbi:MAG: DEAD/DEAH box helicase [Magnetococcales bacterium]|nr:DEAD/DEAH box helicase [Magnetococcales bacterium]